MYRERKKKWRTIKLVFTEIIMVLSVIAIVVILTLFAMGYRVNQDAEVVQQGLVQIQSHPTGAIIKVDDEEILQHTNTSKLLNVGSHKIVLSKDGYDTWTSSVMVDAGRVVKLVYPRLFPLVRTPEKIQQFDSGLAIFVPATNHDTILYSTAENSKWKLVDVRGDTAVEAELDLSELLDGLTVQNVVWNENSDKVLISAIRGDKTEWLVIDIKNVEESVNLSQEYALDFSKVAFFTDDGERLLVISNENLRIIENKTISEVLATKVVDFSFNGDDIAYLTSDNQLKMYQENNDDVSVATFDSEQKIQFELASYLDKKYLILTINNRAIIYAGEYPNGDSTLKNMEVLNDQELEYMPEDLTVLADGELFMAKAGRKISVFDAETGIASTFELPGEQMFFLDKYLIGTIVGGKLVVTDFDGMNVRTLSTASGTAFITKNNKWLYYLRVDDSKTCLYREQIN